MRIEKKSPWKSDNKDFRVYFRSTYGWFFVLAPLYLVLYTYSLLISTINNIAKSGWSFRSSTLSNQFYYFEWKKKLGCKCYWGMLGWEIFQELLQFFYNFAPKLENLTCIFVIEHKVWRIWIFALKLEFAQFKK